MFKMEKYSGRLIETVDAGIDYYNQLILGVFNRIAFLEMSGALRECSLEHHIIHFPITTETLTLDKITYNGCEYMVETIIKNDKRSYILYNSESKLIAISSSIFELFSSIKTN